MSHDVDALLRAAARSPGAAPDADTLWHRGRRRRNVIGAGGVGAVLVAVAAAVLLLRPASPVVLAPTPTEEDEPAPRCETAPYRPGYLPWLAEGESPGQPDAHTGGDRDQPSAVLYWAEDPDAFEAEFPRYSGTTLTISTNFELEREPGSGPHEAVQVLGHEGELAWAGDPGIGAVAVVWRERPDPCGSYSVGFGMTRALLDHLALEGPGFEDAAGEEADEAMGQVQDAIEAELLRVVESLKPLDPG